MFIGGLSWETTEDGLTKYMQVFGEIEDCMIMKDMATGRSRGFGFLTFKDPASIDKVLESDHYIDGKKIDPKRAVPKEQYEKAEKCFVGGLPAEVTDAEFKDFFKTFGGVSDATVMHDRETGRSRGFGFVTFVNWDGVQKLLDMQAEKGIFLRDKRVEVKPAALRAQHQRMTGGMYGRGGGRGGRGGDGYNQAPPMPYQSAAGAYGMYGYPPMAPDMGAYYGGATPYGYAPQPGYYPPVPQGPYDGYDPTYSRPTSSVGYYPDQGNVPQTTGPADAEAALAGAPDSSRVGYADYPQDSRYDYRDDRYDQPSYRDDYDRTESRRSDRRDRGRDSRRRDDYPRDRDSRRGYGGSSGGSSRRHPYSR